MYHAIENTANQESRCIFDGITPTLPIMRRANVAIVFATVFSMPWYKIAIQRSLVVYRGLSHLSLVFPRHTRDSWDICCVSLHEVLFKLVICEMHVGYKRWRLEVNTCCSLKTTVSPNNSLYAMVYHSKSLYNWYITHIATQTR